MSFKVHTQPKVEARNQSGNQDNEAMVVLRISTYLRNLYGFTGCTGERRSKTKP